jgi:hypothetical protein
MERIRSEIGQIANVATAGDNLAMRRQRALQLPANLTILAEQKNLHRHASLLKTRAVCHFRGHLLCETGPFIYPFSLPKRFKEQP